MAEFNQNSIQIYQERLKIINEYNTKKKKLQVERQKKELTYTEGSEIKIPITKLSQKSITDQITKYYVQKANESNPETIKIADYMSPLINKSMALSV